MPRLMAEPVSLYTRSGNAKRVTELPRFEMVCPVQYFQKSLLSLLPGVFAVCMLCCIVDSLFLLSNSVAAGRCVEALHIGRRHEHAYQNTVHLAIGIMLFMQEIIEQRLEAF